MHPVTLAAFLQLTESSFDAIICGRSSAGVVLGEVADSNMRETRTVRRIGTRTWPILVTMTALVLLLVGVSSAAPGQANSTSLTDRRRFGFVATLEGWQQTFDVAQIRAGWYVDMTHPVCDPAPEGMERAQVLPVYTGYKVNSGQLGPLVDNHPGTMWLIGNEPDCIWQDDVLPQEYARIYHDLYTFIRSRDLTSQVSPGGIVQPTPLRLEYLDRILAAYQARYGGPMPVDVWNIHNAILNEQKGSWGAEIPPGIDATEGEIRTIDDNDNMTIFEDQIWAFRQWMADNDYGGCPLIVTEYGILMPDDYGFDAARVNAFMSNTFDFFLGATDPALGDPNDGHRLVQRWAWFSLDEKPWDPVTLEGFNGNLFDPETGVITVHGQHYASHTNSFPPSTYVDLGISAWQVLPTSDLASPTQTITRSLRARIVNIGTADSGSFAVALEYGGPVSGTLEQTIGNLSPVSSQWLTFTLIDLQPGSYSVLVWIDPDDQVTESRKCNNQVTTTVVAPTDRFHLPLLFRSSMGAMHSAGSGGSDSSPERAGRAWPNDAVPGFQEFEVPTVDSYPAQITLDTQGRVWITERDGNKLARFDPQTEAWDEYDILTSNSQPWGLAVDGDGHVWFAETAANQIGELIAASGTITEYPITPTPDSQPWDVAIGGGAVWFTEKEGNQIGKLIMASGTISEYSLLTPNAQPAGIAASGSYVWFTESEADKVGRLRTTDGQILEFTPPTPNSAPQDVVLTSGGKPWFTEMGGNKIFAIDPETQGMFLEVDLLTADSEPYGIAMEGHVAIWFTERAANKLGHFTGSIPPHEYWLPTPNSRPTGIVVDGAGCAWYTAPGANRIGRLCLPLRYLAYLPLVVKE